MHETLTAYSEALGIAYQIRDDVDDLANPDDGNDLTAPRPSFPLAVAYERAKGADRELLEAAWKRKTAVNPADVRDVIELLGGAERSSQMLESYKEQAVRTLMEVQHPSLKGLLRRVVSKIFSIEIKGWCSEFETRNAASRPVSAEAIG